MYTYEDIFENKKRVLFVMAHPDDVDVFFGGTITKLRKDKKEVLVLVMTNGCRGSRANKVSEEKLAAERLREQENALRAYGVQKDHFNTLNYRDGEAENTMELIGEIAYFVRKFKPDLVATHNPNYFFSKNFHKDHYHVNHKDHRVCGASTMDAVYPFSRDHSFFPEHLKNGLEGHSATEMLFCKGDGVNTKIDVTVEIDKKRKGMLAHKSQFDEEKVEKILSFFKEDNNYFEEGYYIKIS
jgi:LmbE family N-acetylglucosaminyl deacetylase